MKTKTFLLTISVTLLILFISCIPSNKNKLESINLSRCPGLSADSVSTEVTFHEQLLYGSTLVKFKGALCFLFNPDGFPSLVSTAKSGNYRFIVNGSYFDYSVAGYTHAGWLSIRDKEYAPNKQDEQLSSLVRYNLTTTLLDFIPIKTYQPTPDYCCLQFQTGPMVIDHGLVANESIDSSINGNSTHLRTLMGYDEEGYKYLLITREAVTLKDLANYLLGLDVFKTKTFSFINLDGGSSVALFSKDHPDLNFNEKAKLPILLGVK